MSKPKLSAEQKRKLDEMERTLTWFDKAGAIAHIVRNGSKLLVCSNFGWVTIKAKCTHYGDGQSYVVLQAKSNDGTVLLTYGEILQYLKQCDAPYLPSATSGEPK